MTTMPTHTTQTSHGNVASRAVPQPPTAWKLSSVPPNTVATATRLAPATTRASRPVQRGSAPAMIVT
ncbi:hypothetical protein [Pseudolysinimonas kribbensis]|uniref:hypothetical protein n=1 Tax=Pseudolysinimonas kribbensis TaxID=433641 RepID=UPI0024E05B0D|nr:hypothetical protein [Pseudolysinimonas kribbensis]